MKITINGITRDCTSEEENKISQERQNYSVVEKSYDEENKTKKASGKQKLIDLGLTEEEVKALIGV